jgi:hypothetical protein
MSYEIVKGIKIEDNKVYVNGDSNNVYPKTFKYQEYPYYTKILNEKGEQELNISILKSFEEGNFQSSLNLKWTRALKVLYYLLAEEYKPFSWRLNGEDYEKAKILRESQAFKDLLLKALNTKIPKQKFIILNKKNNAYVRKETTRHIFYCSEKEQAKKYDFKQQAESIIKYCNALKENSEVIEI